MSTIMPFDYDGREVRSGETDGGEPCFVAKDTCEVLKISKYRDAVAQLDSDERVSIVVDTPGGPQEMTAVTESGLYGLMLIAPSETARKFRRWLKHEVLPQIRRTGTYAAPEAPAVEAATPNSYLGSTLSIREVENWAMLSAEADRLCQHTQEHHAFLTSLIALHRLGHVETNDVNRALTELTAAAEVYAAMIRSTAMRRAGIGPWRVTSQRFR